MGSGIAAAHSHIIFPKVVTDHRIGLTLYRLESILDGDLDEIIEALIVAEQTEQLKDLE